MQFVIDIPEEVYTRVQKDSTRIQAEGLVRQPLRLAEVGACNYPVV